MTCKHLFLSLSILSLCSCANDWKVVKGPIDENGEPGDEITEATDPSATRSRPVRRSAAVPPTPLKDNPFAVPNVSHELPDEDDLKPGVPAPNPIPVEPTEPGKGPTVTAKPPAAAE